MLRAIGGWLGMLGLLVLWMAAILVEGSSFGTICPTLDCGWDGVVFTLCSWAAYLLTTAGAVFLGRELLRSQQSGREAPATEPHLNVAGFEDRA